MSNPARDKFLPLLSPYVDGELSPEERQQVEQHLAHNKDSAAQVADFRAADGLIRTALDMAGDDVDWKAFTNEVMGKVVPERLPFFSRLKLSLSELFTYQRGPMIAAMAGAAAAVAIAVPLALSLRGNSAGYANPTVEVQTVSIDNPTQVKPVVMETDDGDAVIWVVEKDDATAKKKKPESGEDDEEGLGVEPSPDQKAGDL